MRYGYDASDLCDKRVFESDGLFLNVIARSPEFVEGRRSNLDYTMRYFFLIAFLGIGLAVCLPRAASAKKLITQSSAGAGPTDVISKIGETVTGGNSSFINPQGIWGLIYGKIQQVNAWSRDQIGIDFLKLGSWIWKLLTYLSGLAIQLFERVAGSLKK